MGQNLLHHPHLHCLVPGGGISLDGQRWIACRPGFFLPVRVLSRLFRGLFLHYLDKAFTAGRLSFFSTLLPLKERPAFSQHLARVRKTEWVVYAEPVCRTSPGPELRRPVRTSIAISNSRLLAIDDGKMRFRWKDYRRDNRHATITLTADEFIRRFLIHVLPSGFQRIRYYGSSAIAGDRTSWLVVVAAGIANVVPPAASGPSGDYRDVYEDLTGKSLRQCPSCDHGQLHVIKALRARTTANGSAIRHDRSADMPASLNQLRRAELTATCRLAVSPCLWRSSHVTNPILGENFRPLAWEFRRPPSLAGRSLRAGKSGDGFQRP